MRLDVRSGCDELELTLLLVFETHCFNVSPEKYTALQYEAAHFTTLTARSPARRRRDQNLVEKHKTRDTKNTTCLPCFAGGVFDSTRFESWCHSRWLNLSAAFCFKRFSVGSLNGFTPTRVHIVGAPRASKRTKVTSYVKLPIPVARTRALSFLASKGLWATSPAFGSGSGRPKFFLYGHTKQALAGHREKPRRRRHTTTFFKPN